MEIAPPQPLEPYATILLFAGALLFLASALPVLRPRRRAALHWSGRIATAFFAAGAVGGASLIATGQRLALTDAPESDPPHLAIVLDGSASVARDPRRWDEVRAEARRVLERSGASDAASKHGASGSLVVFSEGATIDGLFPLEEAGTHLDQIERPESGGVSNLAEGIRTAGDVIDSVSGRGSVLILTDGHETRGDAAAEALRLLRRGIPCFVVPFDALPAVGIVATHLPSQLRVGAPTHARALLANPNDGARLRLGLERNAESLGQGTQELRRGRPSFRGEVRFDRKGIQYVDLSVELEDSSGRTSQRRRLFTYVTGPTRILAVGGDADWLDMLPPADDLEIVHASAAALRGMGVAELTAYDVLTLSGQAADPIGASALARIAEAVTQRGLGLFFANGRHHGGERAPTTLASYEETPLEPLLPLQTRMRLDEPPPREVVLLVDTSSSMCGRPLAALQRLSRHLIEQLNANDKLSLIEFSTNARVVLRQLELTPGDGKPRALRALPELRCGGGTDVCPALRAAYGFGLGRDCAVFIASDGVMGNEAVSCLRPLCHTTVVHIGPGSGMSGPLAKIAEPIPLGLGQDPSGIRIGFLEPPEEGRFFEPGAYEMKWLSQFSEVWPHLVTNRVLTLSGTAVSRVRDDAEWASVRLLPRDPVLAFRDDGMGRVGAIATNVPDAWAYVPEARALLRSWLDHLVRYPEQDRYAIALRELGGWLELRVMLLAGQETRPDLTSLSAAIEVDGVTHSVTLGPDRDDLGVFRGRFSLKRDANGPRHGELLVWGSGESPEDARRIRLLVPPRPQAAYQDAEEALHIGRNDDLLARLATGSLWTQEGFSRSLISLAPPQVWRLELWPLLAMTAASMLVVQVWLGLHGGARQR